MNCQSEESKKTLERNGELLPLFLEAVNKLEICPLVLSVQRQGTGFFGQFVIEVRVLLKLLLGIIG